MGCLPLYSVRIGNAYGKKVTPGARGNKRSGLCKTLYAVVRQNARLMDSKAF